MAQQQQPMQATDTFVATMGDGSDQLVTKGQILPAGHELVKRDRAGSGTLFRPLDMGGEDEPADPKSELPKAETRAPAAVKAPAPAKTAAAAKGSSGG